MYLKVSSIVNIANVNASSYYINQLIMTENLIMNNVKRHIKSSFDKIIAIVILQSDVLSIKVLRDKLNT